MLVYNYSNELGESWVVNRVLIEESNMQGLELRGVDAGHEVLQISYKPFEKEEIESGDEKTF